MTTSPVRLLIGPWVHAGNERSYAGDVEFGPEAAPTTDFPTGFDMNLTDALIRASYRDDRTMRLPIVPR